MGKKGTQKSRENRTYGVPSGKTILGIPVAVFPIRDTTARRRQRAESGKRRPKSPEGQRQKPHKER